MVKRSPDPRFPDRKISVAFMEFSEPILNTLGPDVSEAEINEALRTSFIVWNAVVYADAVNDASKLDGFVQTIAVQPQLATFVQFMIQRKRESFGDDHRLIGEYKMYLRDGEWRLRAEAHDPYTSV